MVFYYKCTSNKTQGRPIATVGYNNTESKSGIRTKYVLSPSGVKTNPITRHFHPRDNKSKSRRMQPL